MTSATFLPEDQPLVSIVIVSFNTREMTIECVRSVLDQTLNTPFEIIVLDNASSDRSADWIATEFGDRVRLIRSVQNLGFAKANNLAAAEATGKYLLLLNPDTVVLDHAIDALVDFAEGHPQAGIWGGRSIFADGSLNPATCWSRTTLWSLTLQAIGFSSMFRRSSLFNPTAMGGWDRSTERQVDIVSGCLLLIRRTLWQRLEGFDPAFFMYGEDTDLCLRAHQMDARPRVTPDAKIIHHGGASETVRTDKLCRLLAAKSMTIDRHFKPKYRRLGKLLLAAWPLSRTLAHMVLSPLRRDSRLSQSVWREVWSRRKQWGKGDFIQPL